MIIIKLIGGLGNQMFQYAAGKSLALKHNTELKIDDSFLKKPSEGAYTQRHLELDIFERPYLIASSTEINNYLKKNDSKITRVVQRRFPMLFKSLRVVESGCQYHKEFERYPENTYLEGFWQSELYFKNYENEIKQLFKFRQSIINENIDIVSKINSTKNSVSLHVRRGDYVKNIETNKFHGICSLDYYRDAIKIIAERKTDITLFVFSDDLFWCKENLKFEFPLEFIETNNSASDLYLMTQCNHNIIANSSFSWWGAWLNIHSDKIIVAPKQWYASTEINSNDIIPEKWLKL